ncbi:MAG: hypothetical protein HDQ97_15045 [Lachnospiraceae bacterium]|nr:hypothetical protein [Lachnospiraceae bacterium]
MNYKKWLYGIGTLTICCILTGCHMNHEWQEATCTMPKTCSVGGETEGEALGHTWVEASCAEPKHCSVCGETEGEALEHTWVEASCAEPKHCSVCGKTEGNSLEHTLTEANYQQPAICEVCGETVGEQLESYFEKNNLSCTMQLDSSRDLTLPCRDNPNYTTTGKITFSDYDIFTSDDAHEALEGYEWRALTGTIIFNDENYRRYGWRNLQLAMEDYYKELDDDISDFFTVNFNGTDFTECTFDVEYLQQDSNDEEEIVVDRIFFRVPIGYDGIVYYVYDSSRDYANGTALKDTNTASFRLN